MLERVFRRLGVEPHESSLFGWAALCLTLLGGTAYALLNASETLFLKRVGVEALPWALLASAAALVLTTGLAAHWMAVVDRPRWLPRVLLMLALVLVPLWWALGESRSAVVFGAFIVVARQVLAVGLLVFWLTLADLVTGRQAKRLFAPLSAGLTVGGIAGSFGSDPIARAVSVEGLVLVGAVLLGGAALCAERLRFGGRDRVDAGPRRPRAQANPARDVERSSGLQMWRESSLFRLLWVGVLCGGILSPVLYFEFSVVADAATQGPDGEQRLLALYAQFRGWLNIVMLFSQLWLSARLYRGLGLPASMGLEPVSYLLGFTWLGFAPSLPAGLTALGASRITESGISNAARQVLFNLFPERIRSSATGTLEGPVTRIGAVLGNASVLTAIATGAEALIAAAAIPISLIWLASSAVMRRAYPRLLLQASAEHCLVGIGEDKAQLLDRATVRALAPGLIDPDPATSRSAIDLVIDAEPHVASEVLAEAVADASPAARPRLVDALHRLVEPLPAGSLDAPRAVAALERLLAGGADLGPEERADLLQTYARITTAADVAQIAGHAGSIPVLERSLGDREPAVRLAAMAELHRRRRSPPGVDDLDGVLQEALETGDVLLRRSARSEVRAMLLATEPDAEWDDRLGLLASRLAQRADRAEVAEALVEVARRHNGAAHPCADRVVRWIHDRDPRVRAAVLRFVGHAGADEHANRLVSGLQARHRDVESAAREGLVALGSKAIPALLAEVELGRPSQRDAAIAVLGQLELQPDTLPSLYEAQLDQLRTVLAQRAAIEGADAALVLRRLEERVDDTIGSLLAIVSVLEADESLAELERRLRRAREARSHDILVEALEAVLPPRVRGDLIPLVESGSWVERGKRAAEAKGEDVPSDAAAWGALLESKDALVQRLARRFAPASMATAPEVGNHAGVLDPMDVALQLQSVPAFDRLSTRQLMSVAEVLEQVRFADGERVYAKGDEGDGLYIVLEGEVEITRDGAVPERIGQGRFFGELSTLDGVPRVGTAVACGDVHMLRLDREELLVMMEDAPTLAIAFCQQLSLRVRALQDQIGSP